MECEKRQEEELGHNMLVLLKEAMTGVAMDCIVMYRGRERCRNCCCDYWRVAVDMILGCDCRRDGTGSKSTSKWSLGNGSNVTLPHTHIHSLNLMAISSSYPLLRTGLRTGRILSGRVLSSRY